ncbi:hypothetical protein [Methylomonas albis]|uniref:Uncharacterized protein n=1 Tax=Methylomonas albis TaxID=1854563 RepID=A0ABR9CZM5_9GAMM|nr:hypothetical protein [Methylomonas albis]MBD9356308.1 hypothetical protein [Methylomonas albis]
MLRVGVSFLVSCFPVIYTALYVFTAVFGWLVFAEAAKGIEGKMLVQVAGSITLILSPLICASAKKIKKEWDSEPSKIGIVAHPIIIGLPTIVLFCVTVFAAAVTYFGDEKNKPLYNNLLLMMLVFLLMIIVTLTFTVVSESIHTRKVNQANSGLPLPRPRQINNSILFEHINEWRGWPVKCQITSVILAGVVIFLFGSGIVSLFSGEYRNAINLIAVGCVFAPQTLTPEMFFLPIGEVSQNMQRNGQNGFIQNIQRIGLVLCMLSGGLFVLNKIAERVA